MKRICSKGHYYSGDRCNECNKTSARGYDHRWRRLSERFRIDNPLCSDCESAGRVTAAEHVHHIKPLEERPELRLVWSNLVSLCRDCHQVRHSTGSLSKEHDHRDE